MCAWVSCLGPFSGDCVARYELRDAGSGIRDSGFGIQSVHLVSRNSYPVARISHSVSRIITSPSQCPAATSKSERLSRSIAPNQEHSTAINIMFI